MPKKKTTKTDGESKPKVKGLFDHINHIREGRNPKYFDTLSEADQKSWSNYMVCRFLSMDPRCIDMINEIQKYQGILQPREFYQLCLAVTPKGRAFYPYIKNQSEEKWSKEVMEILCKHFQESERNVAEYLQIVTKDDVREILSLYGNNEKDIKKLLDE
jgi:hypothetical protein